MLIAWRKSQYGAASQRSARRGHCHGHAAARRGIVAQLANGVIPPRNRTPHRPHEHEVIASAAVIIGHKLVGHAIVVQADDLPVGKICESPPDEAQAGVVYEREDGAGDRRVTERQIHRAACGNVSSGEGNVGAAVISRRQRIGGGTGDDDVVGQSGDLIRRRDHDADRSVPVWQSDGAAGAARGKGGAIDRERGIGVRCGGRDGYAGCRSVRSVGVAVPCRTEGGRETARTEHERGKGCIRGGKGQVVPHRLPALIGGRDTEVIRGGRRKTVQSGVHRLLGAAADLRR